MEKIQVRNNNSHSNLYAEGKPSSLLGMDTLLCQPKNFVRYLNVFHSDYYRIVAFSSCQDARYIFTPNYTDEFRINITRRGYFTVETHKKIEEEYSNRITLDKPGCEFRAVQQQPGEGSCTMFRFTEEGFNAIQERYPLKQLAFFRDPSIFNTIINSTAEADFVHHSILLQLAQEEISRLQLDCLVAELVQIVMHLLLGKKAIYGIPANTKRFHVKTIDSAKEFLLLNFSRDISLMELARHCCVSPFHFTRLFKQFCGCSPFAYLQQVRLKNAEMLIRTTNLPVTDVCFRSGFNRLDYFSATFSKLYGTSPSKYKFKIA